MEQYRSKSNLGTPPTRVSAERLIWVSDSLTLYAQGKANFWLAPNRHRVWLNGRLRGKEKAVNLQYARLSRLNNGVNPVSDISYRNVTNQWGTALKELQLFE